MMLYNSPIRMPISLISEICAIQGTMSALNAPEKKPYTAAKSMIVTRFVVNGQNTRIESPERNAHGTRMLNLPRESETKGGTRRPRIPPAFITDRT